MGWIFTSLKRQKPFNPYRLAIGFFPHIVRGNTYFEMPDAGCRVQGAMEKFKFEVTISVGKNIVAFAYTQNS